LYDAVTGSNIMQQEIAKWADDLLARAAGTLKRPSIDHCAARSCKDCRHVTGTTTVMSLAVNYDGCKQSRSGIHIVLELIDDVLVTGGAFVALMNSVNTRISWPYLPHT
jgi:hypothetical protein